MKICILPRKIAEAVEDLVERVVKSKDQTALLAVDEEDALVVMTWAKYEELTKAVASAKEVVHEHHYPWHYYNWWSRPLYYNTPSYTTVTTGTAAIPTYLNTSGSVYAALTTSGTGTYSYAVPSDANNIGSTTLKDLISNTSTSSNVLVPRGQM